MTGLQETIIKTLHVQPEIDPATEVERRVAFLASFLKKTGMKTLVPVSYTHLRAHETKANLVCRLLLEKKKKKK